MKQLLILHVLVLSLFATDLTVVGLSGSQFIVPRNESNSVALEVILNELNIRNSKDSKKLTVRYNDSKLTLAVDDSVGIVDADTIPLSSSVERSDGLVSISVEDITSLLSRLTGLFFRYSPSSSELSIHREPLLYKDLTGVIVLDPGHGGKDPGAIGQNDTYEKDVVLDVTLKTAEYLRENSSLKVLLTRETDTFLALGERTSFANDSDADLFISIHANSSPKMDDVGGYKMYFLSDAKNETDERIAMVENSALDFEEDDSEIDLLQTILSDMVNNEFLKESQDLSIDLESSFDHKVTDLDALHTGVGQANFFVLRGAAMPSVLVEVCFLSNTSEEALLNTDDFTNDVAEAIGSALLSFRYKQRSMNE